MSVVGARPQFVKLAPVHHALVGRGHEHIIVHTGQHYDPMLSDVFFEDLGIPDPDVHLGVGSGSHGVQTGAILAQMDEVIENHRPDCVLVYGDTNSTLAAALSAAKLHFPLAHLEAGLRSFNRSMPEELNRILTDHAADLCLAPTEVAIGHLRDEGIVENALVVGDVMTDVLFQVRDQVQQRSDANPFSEHVNDGYYIATIHRAENTDTKERLGEILGALKEADKPVYLLAHPRVKQRAKDFGIDLHGGSLHVHEPLPYPSLIASVVGSQGTITDSGGLQKEAFLLRVPCTTVRYETEWVETVDLGWNVLANSKDEIVAAIRRDSPEPTQATPYGNGDAANQTVQALEKRFS